MDLYFTYFSIVIQISQLNQFSRITRDQVLTIRGPIVHKLQYL